MSIDEEGEPSAEDENAEAGQPPEPKTDTLAVKRINLESASMSPLGSKVQLKVTAVDMAKKEASPLGAQKHLNQVCVSLSCRSELKLSGLLSATRAARCRSSCWRRSSKPTGCRHSRARLLLHPPPL